MTCRELSDFLMQTPDYEVREASEWRDHGASCIVTHAGINITRFDQLAEVVLGDIDVARMEPKYQPQPVDDPIERMLRYGTPMERMQAVFAKALDADMRRALDGVHADT